MYLLGLLFCPGGSNCAQQQTNLAVNMKFRKAGCTNKIDLVCHLALVSTTSIVLVLSSSYCSLFFTFHPKLVLVLALLNVGYGVRLIDFRP